MVSSSINTVIPAGDDLYCGPIRCMPVPIAAGTYQRGEVLGLVGNLYGKLTETGAVARAVMPFNHTLSEASTLSVYVEGDFNEDALIVGAASLSDVKTELREVNIIARKWSAAS
jgi:hypothetical protein